MRRTTWIIAASALALAACGQQATTTAEAPADTTPVEAPVLGRATPADFVQTVANSDAFEIQSAEIAAQRGVRQEVKDFAAMMRTDHTATTQQLTTLAPTINLTAPTPTLTAEQQSDLEALRNASNEDFDDLYLDQQVEAHENAVNAFEGYIRNAPQDQLRQWAETTLPKLRQHLEQVQGLENAT